MSKESKIIGGFPSVSQINDDTINISGTSFMGDLFASYDDIVKQLGPPMQSFDGYKTDAEWYIEFDNGIVATVYNWKNGKNYCGNAGIPVEFIKEWHIGGNDLRASVLIVDLINHSWPVFDEVRRASII